jgi:hypothetical protein
VTSAVEGFSKAPPEFYLIINYKNFAHAGRIFIGMYGTILKSRKSIF